MSDILEKIPVILFDLVKDRPIITVLMGVVLFATYAMLSKASPERAMLWAVVLFIAWPVLVYFVAAIADAFVTTRTQSQAELGAAYARFIAHPRLVLTHIFTWFAALVIAIATFVFWTAEWEFRKIANVWRERPRFTIIWMVFMSVLLGGLTSKVHVDLIDSKPPSAETHKLQ